jgi:hypothetical protein
MQFCIRLFRSAGSLAYVYPRAFGQKSALILKIDHGRQLCEDTVMHILLTGGTGLIGQHLCQLARAGSSPDGVEPRPAQVPKRCGSGVRGVARLEEIAADDPDAVVNLAGAPIADRPWTAGRRSLLWASRITLTEQLLAWLGP